LFVAPTAAPGPVVILGLMGLQRACFGPAKYGILPELVPHHRLSAANGRLELLTFVAIIAGTALGPWLLAIAPAAPGVMAMVLTILAAIGAQAARRIQRTEPARDSGGLAVALAGAFRALRADRSLLLAVVGQGCFWTL